MVKLDITDRQKLESCLIERGLDTLADISDHGGFLTVTLTNFADEQDLMDDLDYAGVGYIYE